MPLVGGFNIANALCAVGVTLAAGVPLFICMPPWNDVTLHDMAVRSMPRGGVHYRDVFDTNLPGIDWAMAGVRAAFGWRYEVLRAADLIVIGAEVLLLLMWVARAGGLAGLARLTMCMLPPQVTTLGLPFVWVVPTR